DKHIIINTAEGRQKPRNLARDNRVAISILDQQDPYKYVQIRGKVVETTTEGAREHIDKMARKYRGPDAKYPHREGEVRAMFKIEPEHSEGRVSARLWSVNSPFSATSRSRTASYTPSASAGRPFRLPACRTGSPTWASSPGYEAPSPSRARRTFPCDSSMPTA